MVMITGVLNVRERYRVTGDAATTLLKQQPDLTNVDTGVHAAWDSNPDFSGSFEMFGEGRICFSFPSGFITKHEKKKCMNVECRHMLIVYSNEADKCIDNVNIAPLSFIT